MLDHGCLINHCVKCKAWLNYDSHRLLLQVSIMHLITRYDDENMETNKCLYFRGVPFSWFYKKNPFSWDVWSLIFISQYTHFYNIALINDLFLCHWQVFVIYLNAWLGSTTTSTKIKPQRNRVILQYLVLHSLCLWWGPRKHCVIKSKEAAAWNTRLISLQVDYHPPPFDILLKIPGNMFYPDSNSDVFTNLNVLLMKSFFFMSNPGLRKFVM